MLVRKERQRPQDYHDTYGNRTPVEDTAEKDSAIEKEHAQFDAAKKERHDKRCRKHEFLALAKCHLRAYCDSIECSYLSSNFLFGSNNISACIRIDSGVPAEATD
jgi:hypothetical protein